MSRSRTRPATPALARRGPVPPRTPARPPARAPAPRRSSGLLLSAFVLVGVPLALAGTPTLLLIAVGMLPTLVALVVDRTRDKLLAITVGSMNTAGLLVPLTQLWTGSNDVVQAVSILMRPGNGVVVYGAAAVGWAFHFAIPGLVASVLVAQRRQRIVVLAAEQKTLVEAWGEEVRGRSVVRPPPA